MSFQDTHCHQSIQIHLSKSTIPLAHNDRSTWTTFRFPERSILLDHHELTNAVDQMNREITNRYDFKGSNAKVELKAPLLNIEAENEFQIKQMHDIIYKKLASRSIDTACLEQGTC